MTTKKKKQIKSNMALNKSHKVEFSRELRKSATPPEQIVWELLRDRKFLGLKFRRQHILVGFVVDFYCSELKLALEIDGKVHEQQKDYDAIRQGLIEDEGIRFIRITTAEMKDYSATALLEKIKAFKDQNPL